MGPYLIYEAKAPERERKKMIRVHVHDFCYENINILSCLKQIYIEQHSMAT